MHVCHRNDAQTFAAQKIAFSLPCSQPILPDSDHLIKDQQIAREERRQGCSLPVPFLNSKPQKQLRVLQAVCFLAIAKERNSELHHVEECN